MSGAPWQTGGCHHFCVSRTPSNPEFADSLLSSAHTCTSTGTRDFRQSCSTWNTHTNEPMDSSSQSKLTWYQADRLVTWLVNRIHFLLVPFQAPHSLFLHLVWFLSLEVKWQWLYKSCSESVSNAHVKTVLPSSASTPGVFLLLNNALNDI